MIGVQVDNDLLIVFVIEFIGSSKATINESISLSRFYRLLPQI
jgi:hypothetical protein